eukprot:1824404-Alexandrium_andersonii.AAC.1
MGAAAPAGGRDAVVWAAWAASPATAGLDPWWACKVWLAQAIWEASRPSGLRKTSRAAFLARRRLRCQAADLGAVVHPVDHDGPRVGSLERPHMHPEDDCGRY